jgi:hypothetical protein
VAPTQSGGVAEPAQESHLRRGLRLHGRRQVDPRGRSPGRPGSGRRVNEPEQWYALIKDRLPAYISWEQYERNLSRLKANRARAEEVGVARRGASLLAEGWWSARGVNVR